MSEKDFEKVLELLKAGFPDVFAFMKPSEMQTFAQLYYGMFGKYDLPIMLTAVKKYLLTEKNKPRVAGLQEQINETIRVRRIQQQIETPQLNHVADPISEEERAERVRIMKERLCG